MASPYRFDADPYKDIGPSRSRTGLSAVTAGATSGGEGYRRSALLPGSRGFAAANFGAPPRTDYVAPVTPPVEETPTATQTATPTVQPSLAPIEDQPANGRDAEGAGAETGIADGGPPGDLSDLGFGVNGATLGSILGGIAGGLLAGPPGALAGSLAGKAVGSSLSSTPAPEPVAQPTAQPTAPGTPGGGDGGDFGSGSGAGSFGGGLGDMGAAEMGLGAGGLGAMSGSDIMGFSRGGRVTPNRLMKGMPMHGQKGGLGAVTAGKKPFMGGYAGGGRVGGMPHYMDGGPVDALAGPDPAGPDDGYAALDQGEFVVRQSQAQRPDYAPILDQMNQGTYSPDGSQAHEGMESAGMEAGEGGDDLDLDMGANGNYPPSTAESATPDDMMQRIAMMPPEQSQALSQAVSDPMVMGALFALLGPPFMGVMSTLQQQGQQAPGMGGGGMQPPGMLSVSPDRAGMRPPGGGLGAINA